MQQRLPEKAEFLAGQIALSNDRQKGFSKAVKADEEDSEAKANLAFTEDKLIFDTNSLKHVIELSRIYGIEVRDYQTLLVKTTGEISSETLDSEVLSELFKDWWLKSKFAVQENSISYLIKAIVFVSLSCRQRFSLLFSRLSLSVLYLRRRSGRPTES